MVDILLNRKVRETIEQMEQERDNRANAFMPTLREYCDAITKGKRMSIITNDRYTASTANVWNATLAAGQHSHGTPDWYHPDIPVPQVRYIANDVCIMT